MKVSIKSSGGYLDGIFSPSKSGDNKNLALLLHPHPEYDGNMHSKVVYTMHKAFKEQDFATLRFNFRGVGASEGNYDDGVGELIDSTSSIDWLVENCRDYDRIWVAGFSFGAYIALQLMMRRLEVSRFISVGTPVTMFDIYFAYPATVDGMFIHGEKDEIISLKKADKAIKKIMRSKDRDIKCEIIPDASHFFDNKLDVFEKTLKKYIVESLKKEKEGK